MATVFQYELDAKGTSENNLVTEETHTLYTGKKIRAIAPLKGAFFVNSVKIREKSTGRTLHPYMDYLFTELYDSLTIRFQKEIAGVILITNQSVEDEIEIDYQALGWEYELPASNIAAFINAKSEETLSNPSWFDLQKKSTFLPSPLVHQLGTNFGFEYLNYALERIRSAIQWSDHRSLDFIVDLIDRFTAEAINLVKSHIDNEMRAMLNEYRKKFTKELADLKLIQNLPAASEEEGRLYASKDWEYKNQTDNKYIIISSLMGFKEVLYSVFISTDRTGLGKFKGVLATPQFATMYNMTNGTRFIFDSLENVQLSRIPYDLKVYPDTTMSDSKWIIHKLVNQPENRNGIFAAYSLKTSELYTGILTTTATGQPLLQWVKHITQVDANNYIQKLVDHMEDLNNPHKSVKFHVGLGEVENLPVVTREDVICRKPVRKYVTYDALLLFWKVFMKDVKQLGDEEDPETEITVAERFRLIFAPCGPCGTQPYEPPPPKPIGDPIVEPRGKLMGVWCNRYDKYGRFSDGFGGTYEALVEAKSRDCRYKLDTEKPERGKLLSTYCEGTTLYGRYADGMGSFYVAEEQKDSPHCGGISTGGVVLVEIMDYDNQVIGLGYSTVELSPDPDASIMLTDEDGDGICYIYPHPKAKIPGNLEATIEIKDAAGAVLGYAIKP